MRRSPIESTSPPPKPNGLAFLARFFPGPAGIPPRVDRQRQERLLHEHRGQVLTRIAYLDRIVAAYRIDDDLPDLPPEVHHGIERRLARLRDLAAAVRGYARAERWSEAWKHYEHAERVFVEIDHWIARSRAELEARRQARQRTKARGAGAEAKRRKAATITREIEDDARAYRRRHPDDSLGALIGYLRRGEHKDLLLKVSDSTLRRYLRSLGLK